MNEHNIESDENVSSMKTDVKCESIDDSSIRKQSPFVSDLCSLKTNE